MSIMGRSERMSEGLRVRVRSSERRTADCLSFEALDEDGLSDPEGSGHSLSLSLSLSSYN